MVPRYLQLTLLQGNGIHQIAPPQAWPDNFSFLIKEQGVEPSGQQSERVKNGRWFPPHKRHGIQDMGNPSYFRWTNGVVETMTWNEFRPLVHNRNPVDTATVFYSEDSFFAVNFDARRHHVRESLLGDWKDIGFHYVRLTTPAQPPRLYAQLDYAPAHTHLPAHGSSRWIPDLFPPTYHFQANDAFMPNASNAGLIGRLPLIFSLVAFSCASEHVAHYTRHCVQRQRWAPHNRPHGREFSKELQSRGPAPRC